MTRRACSTSAGDGPNAALAGSICAGWIIVLPSKPMELAERLLAQAKEQGVSLVDPGGLLNQLTRNVLETALEAELTEHLGHEHG
jgi:hypothetical protein